MRYVHLKKKLPTKKNQALFKKARCFGERIFKKVGTFGNRCNNEDKWKETQIHNGDNVWNYLRWHHNGPLSVFTRRSN